MSDDVHELLRKAKAGAAPVERISWSQARSSRERKREEARARKKRKVKAYVTQDVRTPRTRVPELPPPVQAPAHDSIDLDAIRQAAYDDAAVALTKAIIDDDVLLKKGYADDDGFTVKCECGWKSGEHRLLANANAEYDMHVQDEHDDEAPAPAQKRKPWLGGAFMQRS